MSKEKKDALSGAEGLIPELRFPEFVNKGQWSNKPISKIGETVNGLSGKKGADFGSGSPYVQYKQVFNKSFIDFSECGKVDVGVYENQNQLQLGDILFTTSSETPDEVGFASVITEQPEESTYLNSFCFILRPNDLDEINPGFSRYLFHSPIYRKSVSAIAQGSTRYNLSKGAFLKLRVPVPQPQEQQKIAACLSSLDELIAAHQDKLAALKEHKKGLMQHLFPPPSTSSGGETMPKVRFPEFLGDGEWVENELGQIGEPLMCKRIFKDQTIPNPENGIPFYKIGTFGKEPDAYISIELYEEFKAKYNFPNQGDILISASGTIGRLVVYDGEPAYFQDSNIVWLRHDKKDVSNEFLYYCYSIVNWQTVYA